VSEAVDSSTGEVVAFESAGLARFEGEGGIAAAHSIAKQLDDVVQQRGLAVRIGQGEHLRVEAWCCLASLVGVSPVTDWTRDERHPETGEWEGVKARVEVKSASSGRVIGAAECGCYRDEPRWANAERHAVLSMAQTRATSKALGQVLRWIPELAGYSGTPAEEMPAPAAPAPAKPKVQPAREDTPEERDARIKREDAHSVLAELENVQTTEDVSNVKQIAREVLGAQDVPTQSEPRGEAEVQEPAPPRGVADPISEAQANRALVICSTRARELGIEHPSDILNSVLNAGGVPKASHGATRDDILLHLCEHITWKNMMYKDMIASIESYEPVTEVPF